MKKINKRKKRTIRITAFTGFLTVAMLAGFVLQAGSATSLKGASGALRQHATTEETNEFTSLVKDYQKQTKCQKVSVVIANHGECSFYGNVEALYQIGSMTKAFTGLAVQKMILEGTLDEEAPISDYLPNFEATYEGAPATITIRDLLEQKSGYTNAEKLYPSATEEMTLEEWAESISGRALQSKPGTEYAYSNVNYNLLGLILEKVSGTSYREYMENEILLPLGLEHTYVGYPSERLNRSAPDDSEKTSDKKKDDKNHSSLKVAEGSRLGYRETFDYKIPVREGTIPAGYFYSNTEDLGKWMNLWIGEGDIPEEFEEPIAKVKAELKAEGDYTSGWELFSAGVIGHSGGTPNYSSRMVFSEEKKLGVCVLTNLNVAATTDSLCNSIYDLAAGSEARGLSTDIWTVFDLIFIAVSLIGIGILAAAVFGKNKIGLGILDGTLILLLVLIFLIFPMIFGAGMKEILFTWGPWSMTGGIAVLCLDVLCLTGKMIFGKKKTAKTSE